MSFREVFELRKAGKIEAAYEMAVADLAANKDDINSKRSLAWVLCDKVNQQKDVLSALDEIAALQLDEKELYESLAWAVAKYIMAKAKQSRSQEEVVDILDKVFEKIRTIKFSPSNGYSYLFKIFHKNGEDWNRYLEFCDWWGFDNFQKGDYEEFKTDRGASVMALVEQAYIGYAKALLKKNDKAKIEAFIPQLEEVAEKYPKYQYPSYFAAKLYLAINRKEEATRVVLPFVRKKPNDYWVWQILGDASVDGQVRFSCYNKALCCHIKPEFLVKIKVTFAHMLAQRGLYNEAKTEVQEVVAIRNAHQWKLTPELREIMQSGWYINAVAKKNNNDLYKQNAEQAEALLFVGMVNKSVLIVGINNEKKIANYVAVDAKGGLFPFNRLPKNTIKEGELYKVYFSQLKDDGFGIPAKVNGLSEGEKREWEDRIIDFKATVRKHDKGFAVVKERGNMIFIPPQMLHKIEDGATILGKAVKSWDSKKKQEGWTAYKIELM